MKKYLVTKIDCEECVVYAEGEEEALAKSQNASRLIWKEGKTTYVAKLIREKELEHVG